MTMTIDDAVITSSRISAMQNQALAHFQEVGYPKSTEEEWRHFRTDAIANTRFVAPHVGADSAAIKLVQEHTFGDQAALELVFINGRYHSELSRIQTIGDGITVQPLAQAVSEGNPTAVARLGTVADVSANPFVALNTGSFLDGVFIDLPTGSSIAGPVHLLFVSTAGANPTVTHPRVLVVAGDNVEAAVVETYTGDGVYFTNPVTEFIVGQDSRIDHCKLQQESSQAYHVAAMSVHLESSALFVSHSISLGALLSRNDVNVKLDGERADATINGLVIMDGHRVCDNHTLLDHSAAHCPSHELYKHVLSDQSRGVFKGKILVRPDSQKTDSKQTSKTLLLSDDARMNSMPALEIYADDVKCTHGSTTGPVDEEQVFYLRSRGVSADAARHLMTYAFAADITRRIRVTPVRARVENFMANHHGLPLDLRITDLGAHDEKVVNA